MSIHWGGRGAGHINRLPRSIGQNPYSGATMLLDFTNPVLDPRITFSRGTNATLVDSTGKITYAPNNLLTYSEDFSNAAWTKTNATITANTEIAPDGTMTADTFTATAANGLIRNDPARVGTFINSIYVKRKTGTGVVQILNAAGSYTAVTVTSEWTRVSAAALATGASLFGVRLVVSGDEIYIWGAQAEQVTYQTTPSTYVATTASAYYGPRFDYDPVTLAPRGLLIEEARTNLLTYSEQFDNAAWVKLNATINANATTSPDGTVNADKLAEDATAGVGHLISQGPTLTAVAHTYSVYAKASERNWICLLNNSVANVLAFFNLTTGTIGTVGSGTTATITNAGNGWYRCSITFTATAAANNCHIRLAPSDNVLSYNGVAGSGAFIYGAQLEVGAFATSYIPTVASTVSRSADVATMTGTNFSSWYNQSEGAFIVEAARGEVNVIAYILTASDNSAAEWIGTYFATSQRVGATIVDGSVTQMAVVTANNSAPINTITKAAVAYKLNDSNLAANGVALTTDTSCTIPTTNRLYIGSDVNGAGQHVNGHIRAIAYYNTRLPNTQLQQVTT